MFAKRLKAENISFEMYNEIQEKLEQEIIEQAGLPGAVTIATNTAGRGTDIKLSEKSLANGGLHVLITFYPASDRVELQARGRAGRQGQPGSSAIVLSREQLEMHKDVAALQDNQLIEYLGEQRQRRAIREKDLRVSHAILERSSFEMVAKFYCMLNVFHESAIKDGLPSKLAAFLNNRKFLAVQTRDFSGLSPKNRKIAETVLKFLNAPQDFTVEWKVLTQQLIQRVQHHVINDFAINFHSVSADVIQDSKNTRELTVANMIKEAIEKESGSIVFEGKILEAQLRAWSAIKLIAAQAEMKEIFEKQKPMWEKYLDPSGRGILAYLSEMSKIDLNPQPKDLSISPWVTTARTTASLIFDRDFDNEKIDVNALRERSSLSRLNQDVLSLFGKG